MTKFKTLDDLPADLSGKVALVRVDLNLPMQDGAVTDDTRVRASAPTILELAGKGAKVLLLAHFGRPKGEKVSTQSVSMTRSGCSAARWVKFGQSMRWIETPLPRVTKPWISSGGAGLQQRASCVSRLSTPTIRMP